MFGSGGFAVGDGRTSHEVRGLKPPLSSTGPASWSSHLTRGAWIETVVSAVCSKVAEVAPHTRCVD
ncbi:hypothetical protein HMPREF3038_03192 [Akkermansia sp. KLE1797]|nr:hypothetical protein HMPREF3038_03192 [Akkermansia sp. KLE1797]